MHALVFNLNFLTYSVFLGIMANIGVDMVAFWLALQNYILLNVSNTILAASINQILRVGTFRLVQFPSPKEPKEKDSCKDKRQNCDHKNRSVEPSSHKEAKKMKWQVLEFHIAHFLASILTITNGGVFVNSFVSSHLIDLKHITDHNHHMLNKSDNGVNWEKFWAFQSRWWLLLNIYKLPPRFAS